MGAGTKIEWTDISWSPWWGCTKVSVGAKGACELCYAEALDKRTGGDHWGVGKKRRELSAKHWGAPLKWNAEAAAAGKRLTAFPSMCDPFDNEVPIEWLQRFVDLMRDTPNLIWLLLTKRPQNIVKRLKEADRELPPNVALGATVVTQKEAERDVIVLQKAAADLGALTTFVSCEPLMEAVDLARLRLPHGFEYDALRHASVGAGTRMWELKPLGWVIAGGESSGKARPSHPDWFRSLRDQCAAAGVPFLFKQWGEWAPHDAWTVPPQAMQEPGWPTLYRTGKKAAGRVLDGRTHDEFPDCFQKRKAAA